MINEDGGLRIEGLSKGSVKCQANWAEGKGKKAGER
jgi:hypothetical protein